MKCLVRWLALLTLAGVCSGQGITYLRIHRPIIEAQLKLAQHNSKERVRTLRRLFEQAGCPQIAEQTVPKEETPNLICILPGDGEGTVVFGASLDYAAEPSGASAGWGTLALLPLMAESLNLVPHQTTFIFTAFAGADHGLRGSTWYVDQLTDARRKAIWAMVDLDQVGRTPAVYAMGQTDKTLATWLQVASHSLQLPTPGQVDTRTAAQQLGNGAPAIRDEDLWSNAKPFVARRIPSITVRSATPDMLPSLRRQGVMAERVTGTGFDLDAFEDAYRMLCVYAIYLDRNLGLPLIDPGSYTGKIIDTAGFFGVSPVDLTVDIDRFTTRAELRNYEVILKEGGQAALADALSNEKKGSYRFGLQLALGAGAIVPEKSGDKPSALVIGTRMKPQGATGLEYRFVAIRLTPDAQGNGTGSFYDSVKLRFNRKHEIEIEDFGHPPDDIRQVRLDLPGRLRTTQRADATAGTEKPRSSAPSSAASTPPAAPSIPPTAATPTPPGPDVAAAAAPGKQDPPAPAASGQTAASEPGSTATFTTRSQLVQLDVAVTDSHGKPVLGLKESDFTVFEDGVPQPLRAFEPHFPGANPATTESAPQLQLPPHTYTNKVTTPFEGTLNILLLDLMNTPLNDQAFARKQALEFLKALPKGKPLAVFVLGSHLSMVQAFTDDSKTLVAAAEKVLNERSLLLTTEGERQQQQGFTDSIARNALPGLAGVPAQAAQGLSQLEKDGSVDLGSARARARTDTTVEAERTAQRVVLTLDAMAALARSVSSYPARKNLVWLSGSFPITLKPNRIDFNRINSGSTATITGLDFNQSFAAAVRSLAASLATARIAVYPIDVRGLQLSGVDLSVGAAESASFTGSDQPGAYGRNLISQSEARFGERSSMMEVAEQTGGQVIPGNDVRGAIGHALDDGSTYYALAYPPRKDNPNQDFRKIEVKVGRPGLKLAYRPGYYPNGSVDTKTPKTHPLIIALQPGVPDATVVPLTVEVLPPSGTGKAVWLNYTIDIRGLSFADTPEHKKRGLLDCIAVAFSPEGVPVGQASNGVDATLSAAEYESNLRSGLAVHQEIELPPGRYDLRLGVMDRDTQKIGTLTVPIAVPAAN